MISYKGNSRALAASLVMAGTLLLSASLSFSQTTVSLAAEKDNTLFEDGAGSLSNGVGPHFFAGNTAGGAARRGVIAFDIAGAIPAGATITSVTLRLNVSQTSGGAGAQNFDLHALTADWGEGTSDSGTGGPGSGGGGGAASTTNDATWIHTFFNTNTWTSPGGDFSATVSASQTINAVGQHTFGPAAQMVSDVQGWLDSPASNYGWLLMGNEAANQTAKRFDSRENGTPANRPVLEVTYETPAFPCEDILNVSSKCLASQKIWTRIGLANTSHDGDTVGVTINGSDLVFGIIDNNRARLASAGTYPAGQHTVELTTPAGCWVPMTVTCPDRPQSQKGESGEGILSGVIPEAMVLEQNYPNPFNPTTSIRYGLHEDSWVTLRIFNIKGEEIITLVDQQQGAGFKNIVWNGRSATGRQVASGIYLYKLVAGSYTEVRKMSLMR